MSVLFRTIVFGFASAFALGASTFAQEATPGKISPSRVQQGFDISPIPKSKLRLEGADPDKVGWGSYLVNAANDCSGCHSYPQYLVQGDGAGSNPNAGDPYLGTSSTQAIDGQLRANFNIKHYLAGGQCFGPFMARNLTRASNGLPEGLTEAQFIRVMRTGEDVHCDNDASDPICALGPPGGLLQVMPWPTYHSMTDFDLKAIYAYLKAIPAVSACNTVSNGCPGFSGGAAQSTSYVYASTDDCPNPAPPQ
jgi:hypothetical protein